MGAHDKRTTDKVGRCYNNDTKENRIRRKGGKMKKYRVYGYVGGDNQAEAEENFSRFVRGHLDNVADYFYFERVEE